MNNNNIPIKIPNNTAVPSKKGKLAFIIILFIILLIIIVLVIKTTLNKQRMENRLVKNTFFTEMNFNVTPYKAWCLLSNSDSNPPIPYMITIDKNTKMGKADGPPDNEQLGNYILTSNKNNILTYKYKRHIITYQTKIWSLDGNQFALTSRPNIPGRKMPGLSACKPICIRGKKFTNGIPQNITHIEGSYSLMFWFKINKELFNDINGEFLSYDYPLVYFSNSNITPNYNLSNSLGFFIKPINNTMTLKQDGRDKSTIFNLPYDKWVCVTSVFNNNTIDIYINGRLLKTSVATTLSNYNILNLKWGPYPGDLAFVEINNDLDELNAQSVYENYKYYYGIIDKYENRSNKKILLNTPFFKSPFKPLTHWDMLKGHTGSRSYNSVCY